MDYTNLFEIPRHIWIVNYSNREHHSYNVHLLERSAKIIPNDTRFGFEFARVEILGVTIVFFSPTAITRAK